MNLSQFLKLEDEHYISPENAQLLNRDLAKKSVSDIPESRRSLVLEYLITALNTDSVEYEIKSKLDSLVLELQEIA